VRRGLRSTLCTLQQCPCDIGENLDATAEGHRSEVRKISRISPSFKSKMSMRVKKKGKTTGTSTLIRARGSPEVTGEGRQKKTAQHRSSLHPRLDSYSVAIVFRQIKQTSCFCVQTHPLHQHLEFLAQLKFYYYLMKMLLRHHSIYL
jgi:hypothetical protein